jgi:hypothetical protein
VSKIRASVACGPQNLQLLLHLHFRSLPISSLCLRVLLACIGAEVNCEYSAEAPVINNNFQHPGTQISQRPLILQLTGYLARSFRSVTCVTQRETRRRRSIVSAIPSARQLKTSAGPRFGSVYQLSTPGRSVRLTCCEVGDVTRCKRETASGSVSRAMERTKCS